MTALRKGSEIEKWTGINSKVNKGQQGRENV